MVLNNAIAGIIRFLLLVLLLLSFVFQSTDFSFPEIHVQ